MTQPFKTDLSELDELFERFRQAPKSTAFAPLADACRKAGMIEEALEICRKGLAANPRYASGHVVHGKCLYDAGEPERAESAFERVLEVDADNLVALRFLGVILAERGEGDGARACFEHILAIDPEDRDIGRRLDELADAGANDRPVIETGMNEEAAVAASESLDEDGEDFEGEEITLGGDDGVTTEEIATMTLAEIYASQGYTDRALRIYREVLRRQPDHADVRRKIEALESRRTSEVEPGPEPREVEAPPSDADHSEPVPAAPRREAAGNGGTNDRIDTERNYEQFKRWLRSVSE